MDKLQQKYELASTADTERNGGWIDSPSSYFVLIRIERQFHVEVIREEGKASSVAIISSSTN